MFIQEIISARESANFKQKRIGVTKKGKKWISLKEIEKYVKDMNELTKNQDIKYVIRGLNTYRTTTLKSYGDENMIEEWDDYIKNKGWDVNKFDKFSQLDITIYKSKT